MKLRPQVFICFLLAGSVLGFGQDTQKQQSMTKDTYLDLARQDLRTKKVVIMTEALKMSDAQGKLFWPIYREFDQNLMKLGDEKMALIKDLAASYDTMTDEKAETLAKKSLDLEEERLELTRKYWKKISRDVSPRISARFLQAENMINSLVGLQIASELPLVK